MRLPLTPATATSRAIDVVAVGENSLDLVALAPAFPEPGGKVRLRGLSHQPGGQVASAAAALATLGWRTAYIGRFGADEAGAAGIASLERTGVNCTHVVRVEGAASRSAIVIVDERSGDRTVLWEQDPGLALESGDVPEAILASARVLLVDDFGAAAVEVATRARHADVRTIIDVEQPRPGLEDLLRVMDVIVTAEAFPEAFTGETGLGRALATLETATGAAMVCTTLGPGGSLARIGGREVRTPAFPVPIVDTTGAGDLFRAGFIAGWLGGAASVEAVLRRANAVAALGCQGLGARGHLPTPAEVDALLRTTGAPT
ncbi:MAG: carbohydrate kinase family protein [Vicinamibacterales bacterium]|nr:carbohydrate kinase family protein [Vicinamibacterales bacterium]